MEASILTKVNCTLGESPMWHDIRESIWWVDIEERKIFEYSLLSNILHTWQLQKRISLLLQIENETDLLIALEDGIARFSIITGSINYIQYIEPDIKNNRSNDGACDANGNLWIGTMDINCKTGGGALYYINNQWVAEKKIAKTSISNGIKWSLDNKRLFYIDSATYKVDTYLFDLESACIQFEKTIINIPPTLGMPDGMAIDEEGMLWIAHWGGFGVFRWNPETGNIIEKINVPCPHITSCTFGGVYMDTLFISTAKQSLSQADLISYPDSGSIFVAKVSVKGRPANKFKL